MWEPVHAFVEWDCGPRSGIAEVAGRPCVYDSDWAEMEGDEPRDSTFRLMPIAADELAAVAAVLADQRSHPDWGTGRVAETVGGTGYPCLMGDPSALGPVWSPLIGRLRADPSRWPRMAGEFRPAGFSEADLVELGHSWVPLVARWRLPTG